jgi:signal transduction histidine kinase
MLHQLTLIADRGLRLTSDLTRTVRLDAVPLELEPINAQQLCEQIVREMAPLYEQYGRKITLTGRRAKPLVLAHRELLTSVVSHFADNALHYGDDSGPVVVSLQARSKGTLRIGVRDHGPALSFKDWRVATKKRQALPTRPQASGLGLYIAEQFSHAMGGAIGLTRHRDGATFYVDVPISEQLSLL